jgi:hypothetical protein
MRSNAGKVFPLAIIVVAAVAAACGGSETSAIETTIRRAVIAYNEGDVQAFLDLHTDQAIESQYGLPRNLAAPRIEEFIGQPQIAVRRLENPAVTGDNATVDFERTQGRVVVRERVHLIKSAGDWKLDRFEDQPLEIPPAVTPIGIQMGEFAFAIDSSAVRNGNIALVVGNAGVQDHEAVVARIDESTQLEQLVPTIAEGGGNETPAGVEEVVAFGAYEPGETTNVVFAEPLEPGRYGVFCFFPDVNDPEHTPHALKGMFGEFTIPG